MRLWRLAPRRHAKKLDGAGNRDSGARWNSGRGAGVVYTSLSVATCILEMLVHFGPRLRVQLPKNLMLVEIEVPDDAGILEMSTRNVPKNASRPLADGRTWFQKRGDEWLADNTELLLLAPSVVSPNDLNAMINPAHPRMRDVSIVSAKPFKFDPRLAFPENCFDSEMDKS